MQKFWKSSSRKPISHNRVVEWDGQSARVIHRAFDANGNLALIHIERIIRAKDDDAAVEIANRNGFDCNFVAEHESI